MATPMFNRDEKIAGALGGALNLFRPNFLGNICFPHPSVRAHKDRSTLTRNA